MGRDNHDLAILILEKLVEEGFVPDCTDTDDETEWEVQDIIEEVLDRYLLTNKRID
jgi:hypothetical protein